MVLIHQHDPEKVLEKLLDVYIYIYNCFFPIRLKRNGFPGFHDVGVLVFGPGCVHWEEANVKTICTAASLLAFEACDKVSAASNKIVRF